MALGGGSDDLEIKVTVDDAGAVQKIEGIDKALEQVGKTAEDAEGGLSKFSAGIITLNQGAELAAKALGLAFAAIPAALDAIKSGQDFNDVASAFDNLTAKAGALGDTLLSDLRAATAGTVTDLELMKLANEGLIAGLKPEAFEVVAKAARSYADATGTDATAATNSFIVALTKGNDAQLKALGLNIDNEAAIKAYASAHGVAAERLSELGKAEAIRGAALEKLASQTANLGEASQDVGDVIDTFGVSLSNAKDKAFAAAAQNEELQAALRSVSKALQDIDVGPFVEGLGTVVTAIAGVVSVTSDAIGWIGKLNSALESLSFFGSAAERASFLTKELQAMSAGLKSGVIPATKATEGQLRSMREELSRIIDVDSKFNGRTVADHWNDTAAAFKAALPGATGLAKAEEDLAKKTDAVAKGADKLPATFIKGADASKKAADAAKKQSEEFESLLSNIHKLTGSDGVPELERKFEEAFKSETDAKKLAEALEKIATEAVKIDHVPIDQVAASLENGSAAAEDFKKTLEDLAELQKGSLAELFNKTFGSNFAPGGFFGFDLGGLEASTEQAMASALEGALGNVASAFADGRIGKEETKQLVQAAGTAIGAVVGGLVTSGSAAGVQAGAAIGGLIGALASELVGNDSAGTKARKEADKFFAEMFDAKRLKIIVDGELRELYDLVFQGDTPFGGDNLQLGLPGFTAFFDSLPAQAQAAFAGVGAAFEELLGVSEELAGQLGAVLANNIGGELNNLQLAIYATGYSLEQLTDALIASLEKGQLSFAEAQSALNGLQEVMQDGIPGAVGDVTQAFANLQAAGSKGGIATVDAIKDIAFEAEELGFTTFPQIIQHLISTGQFTAEEIQQVFDALAAAGIDTIDDLQNATTQDLIPALAQLENQGFLTETLQQASDLIDKLNDIPETIESTVKIRFEYENGSAEDLEALRSGNGGLGRSSSTAINYRTGGVAKLPAGGTPSSSGGGATTIFQANQKSISMGGV